MNLRKSDHCLNCGNPIADANYCPHCGQINTHKRVSVKDILRDFFGDYFTFDSKFFRSLIPLLLKPGFLTREYVDGRRVSYIFPLRLYLFTTSVFFFVVAVNTKFDAIQTNDPKETPQTFNSDSLNTILDTYAAHIPADVRTKINQNMKVADSLKQVTGYTGEKKKFIVSDVDSTDGAFARYIKKKASYFNTQGDQGKVMFWKAVINQIPKLLFILMPIFALILKILYIRRKIYYVEHLVFALHVHTFIFLFLIIAVLIPKWYVILGTIVGIFIYLFLSIKYFYRQSILKSLVKFHLLLFMYLPWTIPGFIILMFMALASA